MAPPVERVWIEKDDGTQRPIGKPCGEATSVQRAVGMILEAICAPDFHALSHGCRKGHRPHQALPELRAQWRTLDSNGRVDAEVSGLFDTLDGSHLRAFIQPRVKDGSILRLIGKGRHAGVLEAGALVHPDTGTPPGGGVAPMLAQGFVPHVRDAGCVKDVQPRMQGRCFLPRFAEDCILGCALAAAARRVREVVPKRCARCRRTMHPEQTALMAFKRPPSRDQSARGTGTCDFLGFTPSWGKTRQGYWVRKRKTSGKRLRRCMQASWAWGRAHRHAPLPEQHRT